jgi:hypothetical protein
MGYAHGGLRAANPTDSVTLDVSTLLELGYKDFMLENVCSLLPPNGTLLRSSTS